MKNIVNETLLRTLSHTNSVAWSIDLLNANTIVSGTFDQKIKVWDWQTGECLNTTEAGLSILSLNLIKTNVTSKTIWVIYIW